MSNRYHITTFGCQMNEHDSEKLAGMLENMGYMESNTIDKADVIILNTCSVRENADLRFFGNLGRLKHLKKENPNLIVGVCGCMMQQPHIVETIKKKYSFVDMVFGTHNLHEFPEMIAESLCSKEMNVHVWDKHGKIIENLPVKRRYDTKAFINVMYGCNNFCTYCIVPYTRGRERSREPDDILKEVRILAENGTKEVMLLGQNVNSYGRTLEKKMNFAELLYRINEIPYLERIRFMTSHPKDLSDKLIEAIRDCEKICDHIHLPVQSGSTRILKLMNRQYTKEHYLNLTEKLRKARKGIAVSTDIIVGFPGETEEDFNETMDLIRKVQYDSAFTFLYSPRKGTPAEKYEDLVDSETKHKWFDKLVKELNIISHKKNLTYEGMVVDILVEGKSKTDEAKLSGRTSTNKLVNFLGSAEEGDIVTVKITKAKTFSLEGEMLKALT